MHFDNLLVYFSSKFKLRFYFLHRFFVMIFANCRFKADIPITPSTHRQRVGDSTIYRNVNAPGRVVKSPREGQSRISPQAALRGLSSMGHRNTPRFPAVGLTSGLKAGQPPTGRASDSTAYDAEANARSAEKQQQESPSTLMRENA